ncbi:MAK10-like protein [Tanacetum coccineum]
MGDENHIRTLEDYSKPSHEGYKNTIELPIGNNDPNQHLKDFLKLVDSLDLDGENWERTRLRLFQFSFRNQASNWLERLLAGSITTWEDLTTRFLAQFFPPRRTAKLRNDILIRTIDQSASGKLHDRNAKESKVLFEDHALYDNESWNDRRYFAKPVKAIALPQDVLSISDRRLIELKNQVQCLMKAHLTLTQPTQVNKITTSCKICSGPHDTQYCMEDPEQAFVEYVSSRTDEAGGLCVNIIPLYLFKKLNIRLLEETDHIFELVDGTKSYRVGIVKDVEVRIGKVKLLNDFYVIDMRKDPETPLLVGRGFLATANAVIECRMAKIAVGEGITRLYLMRRSLEVLRKFHWMILGGRLNQLSHVSSPLLSKPGEY